MNNLLHFFSKCTTGFIIIFILHVCELKAENYKYIDSLMLHCPAKYTRSTKDIADYINSNFSEKADKLRAAYSWVSQNIYYDVSKMNTGITYKHESEVVESVLKTRKTICFGFAATLKDIAEKTGVKVITISGYTKQNNKIDNVQHVWCATKETGEWLLLDPTWSSGYVVSGKYQKKFNDKWYLVNPDEYITTHMSFDPVWQFSFFPLNNKDFSNGIRPDSTTSRFFNYKDTITFIGKLPEIEQIKSENKRVRSIGITNSMITKHLERNDKYLNHLKYNENVTQYNAAVNALNQASALYNQSNGNARELDKAANKLSEAKRISKSLDKDLLKDLKQNLEKSIAKLEANISKHNKK